MKSCPRCGSTYPDTEQFCESDGTALVADSGAGNRATMVVPDGDQSAPPIICPECQGKAEPGETICNFCGTQLQPTAPPPGGYSPPPAPPRSYSTTQTAASPENFVPSQNRISTGGFDAEPDYDAPIEEASFGQRFTRGLGYAIAAIIAIAAGAWFALHLSSNHASAPVAVASPALNAPTVTLARNMQVAIKGGDLAAALKRDPTSVRSVFDSNRDAVLDTYKQALERDNTLRDGMVVRLHVLPDGSVDGGSVMVSTSINPSLDAEVVKSMSDWKFAPSGTAPVDIDYPLIFATSSSDIGSLEADLNTKFASLGPDETPEYASAPSVAPDAAGAPPPKPPHRPPLRPQSPRCHRRRRLRSARRRGLGATARPSRRRLRRPRFPIASMRRSPPTSGCAGFALIPAAAASSLSPARSSTIMRRMLRSAPYATSAALAA